jgi:subtilase family serine protease
VLPVAAALALTVASGLPATASTRVQLPSPNAAGLTGTTVLPLEAGLTVKLQVHLAPQPGLAAAATAVSTPGNAAYGHYLTAAQARARYGSTAAQAAAVTSWLTGQGFTVTGHDQHSITVSGTVAQVNAAFATQVSEYDTTYDEQPRPFVSRLPGVSGGFSVPAAIAGDITSVSGISTIELPEDSAAPKSSTSASSISPSIASTSGSSASKTTTSKTTTSKSLTPLQTRKTKAVRQAAASPADADVSCSAYWGQHTASIPSAYGHTTANVGICGYTPDQLRSAYGVTGSANTGKGRTVAILISNYLTGIEADTNRFFTAHGLKGFAPGQYREVLSPNLESTCTENSTLGQEDEIGIDVQAVHMAAPDAKVVLVGTDCDYVSDLFLGDQLAGAEKIVDEHLADVVSSSWGLPEESFSPAEMAPWEATFQLGALEGISFAFATGDEGDEKNADDGSIFYDPTFTHFPASDPWATAVGGTTLAIGEDGTTKAEYPWGDNWTDLTDDATGYTSTPPGEFFDGSGGGVSSFAQPAYQRGIVPYALAGGHRTTPDISADAGAQFLVGMNTDAVTGGVYAEVAYGGGTSASTPIIAGLLADAEQAAGHPFGFANPVLYGMRNGAGIKDILPVDPADPPIVLGQSFSDGWFPGELISLGEDGTPGTAGILTAAKGYDDVTGIGAPSTSFVTTLGAR